MLTSTLHFRDLLHATNSPPKEGVLRIFICP